MNTGIGNELRREQVKLERKTGINVFLLLCNYTFLNLYLNHYLAAVLNVVLLIIVIVILNLKSKSNKNGIIAFFILVSLHIFNSSSRCGLESGIYLYYIVLISYLFFLFNFQKDKYKIVVVLLFVVIEVLLLLYTDFSFTKPDFLSNEDRKLMFKISIFGVFESICFLIYFMHEKQALLLKYYRENEILNKEIVKYAEMNEIDLNYLLDLARKDNKEFYIKFESFYPFFREQVLDISPEIVMSDLEIIAYSKLGFTTKEIATYTNSTIRAVESKKYRLRKKLNIPGNIELGIWINDSLF